MLQYQFRSANPKLVEAGLGYVADQIDHITFSFAQFNYSTPLCSVFLKKANHADNQCLLEKSHNGNELDLVQVFNIFHNSPTPAPGNNLFVPVQQEQQQP